MDKSAYPIICLQIRVCYKQLVDLNPIALFAQIDTNLSWQFSHLIPWLIIF
jgi:hypothetical protein